MFTVRLTLDEQFLAVVHHTQAADRVKSRDKW